MPKRNIHPLTYVLIGLAAFWVAWVYGLITEPNMVAGLITDWVLITGIGIYLSVILEISITAFFTSIKKNLFFFPLKKIVVLFIIIFSGVITGGLTKVTYDYVQSFFV